MSEPGVTLIKIENQKYGFVGLIETFQAMAESFKNQPDKLISEELIKQLSKKNYIPKTAYDKYGNAFLREFKKFTGQPFKAEPSHGLEIKVLGMGCSICDGLEDDIMSVLAETGIPADLEHIKDPSEIAKYNVKGTPALVINGEVKSTGATPSKKQIKKWIEMSEIKPSKGAPMKKQIMVKNIPFSEPHTLASLVDYEEGRVVSRTFAQNSSVSITLFAFDEGEGVSTHTAPGDAIVQVLDGEALVNIDGREMTLTAGQVVVMPADIPHSVTAEKRFKMLLTVVKKPVGISL